ncbi:cyclin-D5-1-like [Bidens hawaiensis]|uniref:cyclin-D5-1-like n=1 Tax=Bidens hawaiensis TaxID=980011 RepID=UPI00404B6482
MDDSDTTFSLTSLLCEEDDSSLNQVKITHTGFKPRSEDDHYIQLLIQTEPRSNGCQSCVSDDDTAKNRLKCARLDAVNWIFSTKESLGLHFRTAYLSLTYFDRFNSKRIIDSGKEWAFQLLGIACLSLAAKMEEQKVPLLSHYKPQGYSFDSSGIQRMELMVLTTLEWKMCGITPFAYLHHFFSKICDECDCNESLVSKASEFVIDFSKEVNLMDHRPSVVALAAVLLACDDQLTKNTLECKIGVVSSLYSLEKECIYRCYNLMKELVNKKNTTPESNSLNMLSNQRSSSSNIGIKRKLTYNGFEQ